MMYKIKMTCDDPPFIQNDCFIVFLLSRIQQLTQLFEETKSNLDGKEVELRLELEARRNREMQIKELEDTLAKETDRAQDLKVKIASKIASTSRYIDF